MPWGYNSSVGRLTQWWDELFFSVGDRLVRTEERGPKRYRAGYFVGCWALFALAAHYLGLWAGMTHSYYTWSGAIGIGLVASLGLYVVFMR